MKEWSKDVFSRNLRKYMSQSGKNQKELAKVIGVSGATFNRYVKGENFPRIDKIQKLADYFGILKSDLIEDKSLDEVKERENDAVADVVLRMKMDSTYNKLVTDLNKLNESQLQSILSLVESFSKNNKN